MLDEKSVRSMTRSKKSVILSKTCLSAAMVLIRNTHGEHVIRQKIVVEQAHARDNEIENPSPILAVSLLKLYHSPNNSPG